MIFNVRKIRWMPAFLLRQGYEEQAAGMTRSEALALW